MSLGKNAGLVKSVIVGLRPRQKIKQKQQPKHPEEYEANVCQGARSPGCGRGKQQGSILKKVGDWFPCCCWNDVSYSARNDGGGHEDNRSEVTMTNFFPHRPAPSGSRKGSSESRPEEY
jgi:hypothetical protein